VDFIFVKTINRGKCFVLFCWFFEAGSHFIAQPGLKLMIFLPQFPEGYAKAGFNIIASLFLKCHFDIFPFLLGLDDVGSRSIVDAIE
jgi:hypothetical protein